MDVQLIIAVNVLALCLLSTLMVLTYRQPDWLAWAIANLAVVAGTGVALLAVPDWAGVVSAALVLPLIVAPALLFRRSFKSAFSNDMTSASRYARAAALLHPSPRARFIARLFDAQAHTEPERCESALRSLAATASPEQAGVIKAIELRLRDDWQGVLELTRGATVTGGDLGVLPIRALAETGHIEEAIAAAAMALPHLTAPDQATARLVTLAFAGRVAAVDALLAGELAPLDHAFGDYWRAIAGKNAAPPSPDWRDKLRWIAATTTVPGARHAAERHLATEPAPPVLTSAAEMTLAALASGAVTSARAKPRLLDAPMTLLLLAINVVMFGVEIERGGSENLRVLTELGGMWPPYVLRRGEWWRLGSALFLHFGVMHIAFNGLLLYLLGRDCETRSGSFHLALVYLVGGIASSATVLWLMTQGVIPQAVLVGASGAIFAIFGSEVSRRIMSWLATRDATDQRGLIGVGFALLIQFALDLSIPEVSFTAHASGLVAGLVLGALFGGRRRRT